MSHRSTDPGVVNARDASSSGRDFDLGIPGFRYSDLHDARRLADLAREFDGYLKSADPAYRQKVAEAYVDALGRYYGEAAQRRSPSRAASSRGH